MSVVLEKDSALGAASKNSALFRAPDGPVPAAMSTLWIFVPEVILIAVWNARAVPIVLDVQAPVASHRYAAAVGAPELFNPPVINTLPESRAVTVAPRRTSIAVLFNADHVPFATFTLTDGVDTAGVPAPLITCSEYVVLASGATLTSTLDVTPEYVVVPPRSSRPTIVALPTAAEVRPTSKVAVRVVDPPL